MDAGRVPESGHTVSRTDHHRPWRIVAADRTASTRHLAYYRHHWRCPVTGGQDGCDDPRCGWVLPSWLFRHPRRDDLHEWWHGPERARERSGLGLLAREYNASGDLDDGDFPNLHHRHGVAWLLG